ncbi:9154_t:CDS:2 [Racocetra fulgida]|uniref:9154_t:CDS:1 n=1 Tax=Racocetra fulgida TaxID=60492 RepID=A0A9N8VZG0_9GLOM|nr:9154_t:CDS:2 [Racocetra fulgida]
MPLCKTNESNNYRIKSIKTDDGKITSSVIDNDPTGGRMNDTTSLVLVPCQKVHPKTLDIFCVGVQKFRLNSSSKVLKNETFNPLYDQNSESDMIQSRFMTTIESFEYKNVYGDFITVECEEDWKIAKVDRDIVDKMRIIVRVSSK